MRMKWARASALTSSSGADLDVYVDGHSGRIIKVMDGSRRAYAWAYYALHTLRVPGLGDREGLRIGIVLALLAAGFIFSVIGTIIGTKRILADLRVLGNERL